MAKEQEKITNKAKRNLAQQLYFNSEMTQKDIANYVDVTEKTMGEWVEKNGWREQKSAMQVTSQRVIQGMYGELKQIDDMIKAREIGQQFANSKEADARMKLIKSIQMLQKNVLLPQYVQVMIAFVDYLQQADMNVAKQVNSYITDFLNISAIKLERSN